MNSEFVNHRPQRVVEHNDDSISGTVCVSFGRMNIHVFRSTGTCSTIYIRRHFQCSPTQRAFFKE